MSVYKYFIKDSSKKGEIDEFLKRELKRAGYSRMELTKTPMGTRIVIFAAKPGLVIGRRGQSVRDLTKILEEKFGLENPQISIAPIELPELDPKIMASQLAMALERGVHFRRAAYWAMGRIMDAGALGVEIAISGKLTTQRARTEKYRQGYLVKVGDQVRRQVLTATAYSQLKPGLYGVKVSIVPPDYEFVDRPSIKENIQTGKVGEAEGEVGGETLKVEEESLKEEGEVADTEET
ncbi:MAG: 30S ribosomal protein S3 [Candidatus Bathyarchaeia archaeon]